VNGVGRRQVYTRSELLDHTKQLLLEYGYDGFHLKSLSKRLAGARSTIYQYFANKEEIVAACMRREMEEILRQVSGIDETDCMDALRQLLAIYLQEHGFHQLLGFAGKVDASRSEAAAADLAFVDRAHMTLQQQLERLFARALEEGKLKEDIPLPIMIGVFFNLINTPNLAGLPSPLWSEMLYRLFLEGAGK
jgi:AcrR family transcriptional regulator